MHFQPPYAEQCMTYELRFLIVFRLDRDVHDCDPSAQLKYGCVITA